MVKSCPYKLDKETGDHTKVKLAGHVSLKNAHVQTKRGVLYRIGMHKYLVSVCGPAEVVPCWVCITQYGSTVYNIIGMALVG